LYNISENKEIIRSADFYTIPFNREPGIGVDNQPATDDNELMICKTFFSNNGKEYAQVTFTIPNTLWADQIYLVGDFNDWDRTAHPLRHDRDGNWTITVDLEAGRAYQFRYLIDGTHWTNDNQADAYVHNPYGSDNFMVITDPDFEQYTGK
jgi:1,4-alpha-glucan branching enzyme